MKKEREFIISLDVIIASSIRVKGVNEAEAMESLLERLNSYNVDMKSNFDLETDDGGVHSLDAHDLDIIYQDVEEITQRVYKKKNTA